MFQEQMITARGAKRKIVPKASVISQTIVALLSPNERRYNKKKEYTVAHVKRIVNKKDAKL